VIASYSKNLLKIKFPKTIKANPNNYKNLNSSNPKEMQTIQMLKTLQTSIIVLVIPPFNLMSYIPA